MSRPEFEDLPFDERPDLTPYLIHLTKNTKEKDKYSAFDNLVNILEEGEIWGSSTKEGFIKGHNKATCFMDIPFMSLKYLLNHDNSNPNKPRYEPFGIIVTKKIAYKRRCRPVLYLSNKELDALGIPEKELWRVVRFEADDSGWISWIHEREWRCRGSFKMPKSIHAVLVKNTIYAKKLTKMINKNPDEFKVKPKSIIPLTVMCQGLPYL
jgi:hypothetical protein